MSRIDDDHLKQLGYRLANLERRAQIGAERRARSRGTILAAAFTCFGQESGNGTRIDDICKLAGIARGTFYNHFEDLDRLKFELLDQITGEMDHRLHIMFGEIDSVIEQTAAAIRYYLYAARQSPAWGWTLINCGGPGHTFGDLAWHNSLVTISYGITSGEFRLSTAECGRDILMGATSTAMVSVTQGISPDGYAEEIACHILQAFGVPVEVAQDISNRPLPVFPEVPGELLSAAPAASPVK